MDNRGGNAITQVDYHLAGGGVLDPTNTDPNVLLKLNYATPGTYQPSITLTDSLGNTYTQTLVIVVKDPADVDKMLTATWNGMNQALVAGDTAKALQYLNAQAQAKYGPVFTALLPSMAQIVASYSPLQRVEISPSIGEYAINRTIKGMNRVFFIYFLQDEDGVWRIDTM